MEKKQFIDTLFARAKEAGFEACEVYFTSSDEFGAEVLKGELLKYSVAETMGLGFRGLYNGKMGYASTEVLDEEAVDQLVEGAKSNAQVIDSEDKQFIYPGDGSYVNLDCQCKGFDALSAADKIAAAHKMEEAMLKRDSRIESGEGCMISSQKFERTIVNTLGLNVSHSGSVVYGYALPVARDGEDVSSAYASETWMDVSRMDPEKVGRKAADKTLGALNAHSLPTAKMPVLFAPEAGMGLLQTFWSIFSADAAQKGLSLLKGKEGETIAAKCVTLVDDPHRPGSVASTPFDGEGVATKVKKVVDGGVLTTLLHNLKTAHKQGVASTGNAVRGYATPVSIAPSNFYIAPGQDAPEELMARMGGGVVITSLMGMHAGADPATGDFSLSAKGFCVENGKKIAPVKQITVAGNIYRMLKEIQAVGSDLEFDVPGRCCFGCPSLLVPEMSIAGE